MNQIWRQKKLNIERYWQYIINIRQTFSLLFFKNKLYAHFSLGLISKNCLYEKLTLNPLLWMVKFLQFTHYAWDEA